MDDRCGGVPHVARFIQPRIEHQRDRQTNWTQPCDGAEVSEFTGPSFDPEAVQIGGRSRGSGGIQEKTSEGTCIS